MSPKRSPKGLLSLRTALILVVGVVAAASAGALAYAYIYRHNFGAAVVAAGVAFAGTVQFLHNVID